MPDRLCRNIRTLVAMASSGPLKMVCAAMMGCWMPRPTPRPVITSDAALHESVSTVIPPFFFLSHHTISLCLCVDQTYTPDRSRLTKQPRKQSCLAHSIRLWKPVKKKRTVVSIMQVIWECHIHTINPELMTATDMAALAANMLMPDV